MLVGRILFGWALIFMSEMTAVEAAANSSQNPMVSRIMPRNAADDRTFDAALGYCRFARNKGAQ